MKPKFYQKQNNSLLYTDYWPINKFGAGKKDYEQNYINMSWNIYGTCLLLVCFVYCFGCIDTDTGLAGIYYFRRCLTQNSITVWERIHKCTQHEPAFSHFGCWK